MNKAQKLSQEVRSYFKESIVTKTDMPNIELVVKDMMLNNKVLSTPMPTVSTITVDGSDYTIQHKDDGTIDADTLVSSDAAGIEKIKTRAATLVPGQN